MHCTYAAIWCAKLDWDTDLSPHGLITLVSCYDHGSPTCPGLILFQVQVLRRTLCNGLEIMFSIPAGLKMTLMKRGS